MNKDYLLPELGENISKVTIAKLLVSVGDTLTRDQPVAEVEADKASFEIPSTVSGIITIFYVQEGDETSVGQLILSVDENIAAASPALVTKSEKVIPETEAAVAGDHAPLQPSPEITNPNNSGAVGPHTAEEGGHIPAAPNVRRFSREIGIDLNSVPGTGLGGRISTDDVKAHARQICLTRAAPARRQFTITQEADITELDSLCLRLSQAVDTKDVNLVFTALALKASASVISQSIYLKNILYPAGDIHITTTLPADTQLHTALIHCTNTRSITGLIPMLKAGSSTGSTNSTSFEFLNLSGMGAGFTPSLSSGQLAVLCLSSVSSRVPSIAKTPMAGKILPISLTCNQDYIDIATAAGFMSVLKKLLENPYLISSMG